MDWLTALFTSMGTIPGALSTFFICCFLFGVIYVTVKYFKGFRRLHIGNVSLEKDGSVKVKKSSLTDEEIDRIAIRITKEVEHTCSRGPLLRAIAGTVEPIAKTVMAMAENSIANGENGRIKQGLAETVSAYELYREVRDTLAIPS